MEGRATEEGSVAHSDIRKREECPEEGRKQRVGLDYIKLWVFTGLSTMLGNNGRVTQIKLA